MAAINVGGGGEGGGCVDGETLGDARLEDVLGDDDLFAWVVQALSARTASATEPARATTLAEPRRDLDDMTAPLVMTTS